LIVKYLFYFSNHPRLDKQPSNFKLEKYKHPQSLFNNSLTPQKPANHLMVALELLFIDSAQNQKVVKS